MIEVHDGKIEKFVEQKITVLDREYTVTSILMGVPHTVIFVDELSMEEVCKYGMNSTCGLIVNSSRGIIYVDKTEKFAEAARTAAQEVQAQMAEQLKAIL